jgi:two-component system, chemotaxis family, protein-glutamate methylesterase/glutaminase
LDVSYGCVEALIELAATFDPDWPAAVFITLHVGQFSYLPEILARQSRMPVGHARDGERFQEGRVYVAPPDYHLCLKEHRTHLSRGPRENGCRPAIDPMFYSAARAHSRKVIGILMTGLLSDGSNGLHEIQKCGGITVIQDPEDAAAPDMPLSALNILEPDFLRNLKTDWVDHRVLFKGSSADLEEVHDG